MVGGLWTALLIVPLGLGAYLSARHGLRQPSGLPRTLATAVLAWAWITWGMILLGHLGGIERGLLLAWSGVGLMAGLVSRWLDPERSRPLPETTGTWGLSATCALALTLWVALTLGVPSILLPVKVVSDGPIYHLYFAARWWKAGRLFLVATPFGESAAPYFPAGGDLWFTWLLTAWGGDRLARCGQVPFLVMVGLAAVALARRLGSGTASAVVATCWFLTSLPLILFSFEANVDTIFIAGYLAGAYFLLRHALGDDDHGALVLAGLASGLAWGSKPTATVFVPVLLLLGLAAVGRRARSLRQGIGRAALLLGATASTGGYWFARNTWLTGNPLYPLHVEAFGRTWLAGWFPREAMRTSQFFIPREEWGALIEILAAVVDPRLLPFWLLALAGAWKVGRRRDPLDGWVWLVSALAVLNVALYWLLIPYRTQQRFMLHALGLGVVPLSRLLDRSRWLRAAGVVLLAVHLVTPQSWPFERDLEMALWDLSEKVPSVPQPPIRIPLTAEAWRREQASPLAGDYLIGLALLGAGCAGIARVWGRAVRRPTLRGWAGAVAATLALAGVSTAVVEARTAASRFRFPFFRDYLDGWYALESRIGPAGARIAYAGTNLPFYLMGSNLRNEVRYINIDAHPGWLLHDYHRHARARGDRPVWDTPRPGWDRIHPDYRAWLANLRAEQIQLLVVARANPDDGLFNLADTEGFPIEKVWAERHPEIFEPIYGVDPLDPLFRAYRVLPPESATDRDARPHY